VNGTEIEYALEDSDYTVNASFGYMSGGKGKLTDGLLGQSELPLSGGVSSTESNWLAWTFKAKDPERMLNVFFKFEEDMLIDSIVVNVLSQTLTDDVSVYIYSMLFVSLLKTDNATVVWNHSYETLAPKVHGIDESSFLVNCCEAVSIVQMGFKAKASRRLVLGEVQFNGESAIQVKINAGKERNFVDPGRRFTLSCLSNKPNITLTFSGLSLPCQMTKSTGDQYNCTWVKERFESKDIGKYYCLVSSLNNRCQSNKSISVFLNPGIYADVLELGVHLSSRASLSCHTQAFEVNIQFQKRSDGDAPFDWTNSTNHVLVIDSNHMISRATLTLLNFTEADVGVYICKALRDNGEWVYSQNMRVFLLNASASTSASPSIVTTMSTMEQNISGTPVVKLSASEESTQPLSPTVPYVTDSTSGGGGSGLEAGIIGGIVFVILFIIIAIIVIIYLLQRRCQSEHQTKEMVTGVRYDQNNADCYPPYDTVEYTESSFNGHSSGSQNNGHFGMPPVVSDQVFTQQQVVECPDYADCHEPIRPKAKTMPSNNKTNSPGESDSSLVRQASMPPKLGVSHLVGCQTVSNSVLYSEVGSSKKTKKQNMSEDDGQRQSSRDSGLGHDPDHSPVYDSITEQPVGEIPEVKHHQVANLNIYASLEEINRHSLVLAEQIAIEHKEDLNPDLILSFTETSPLSPNSASNVLPYQSVYADPAPLLHEEGPPEMPADKFSQHKWIGQGQFGDVYQAFAKSVLVEDYRNGVLNGLCVMDIPVALKYLRPGASKDMEETFNKEVKFMAPLRHEHVVRLLGVCTTAQPRFMAIEYMENGDLNQYLQRFELDEQLLREEQQLISYDILAEMAADIASGMEYLASKFFIHRDLATRNCLVGNNHMVKIADFGMTRSVYEKNYYRLAGRAILPIRWMAPESFYGKFTMMSDIWAYGITCWEVFMLARVQPYLELEDKDVIENAVCREGPRLLERPACCDDATFQLMMECWNLIPEERPSFTDICRRLRRLAKAYRQSCY
jgi:hypothetical protein